MPRIPRNATRPYTEAEIPNAWQFAELPSQRLDPYTLIPTQYLLVIDRMADFIEGGIAEGDDLCIHVVEYEGKRYIHNGHHRWVMAFIDGDLVPARVFHLSKGYSRQIAPSDPGLVKTDQGFTTESAGPDTGCEPFRP